VRWQALWHPIGWAAIVVSLAAAGLALVGVALAQGIAAGAAAICSMAFLIPGLVFVRYGRRLRLREVALRHVREFVEARETTTKDTLAKDLSIPPVDAERILRQAVAEGLLTGMFEEGRFVSAKATRCGSCGALVKQPSTACSSCGATIGDDGT
jgi:hypothetical protein